MDNYRVLAAGIGADERVMTLCTTLQEVVRIYTFEQDYGYVAERVIDSLARELVRASRALVWAEDDGYPQSMLARHFVGLAVESVAAWRHERAARQDHG